MIFEGGRKRQVIIFHRAFIARLASRRQSRRNRLRHQASENRITTRSRLRMSFTGTLPANKSGQYHLISRFIDSGGELFSAIEFQEMNNRRGRGESQREPVFLRVSRRPPRLLLISWPHVGGVPGWSGSQKSSTLRPYFRASHRSASGTRRGRKCPRPELSARIRPTAWLARSRSIDGNRPAAAPGPETAD